MMAPGKDTGEYRINKCQADANSFTGEVVLHTYLTRLAHLKCIKVNVTVNKQI